MDELQRSADVVIPELQRLLEGLCIEFQSGPIDPDHFLAMSDLEGMWNNL